MNQFLDLPIEIVVLQLEKTYFLLLSQTSLSAFFTSLMFLSILSKNCLFPILFASAEEWSDFSAVRRPYYAKKTDKVQGACALCTSPNRAPKVREPRSKKEVFQPHLPVRLPCYDLAPVTCFALGRSFRSRTSGAPDFHGLTGGVYKARERIHRAMADARLLANPASRSRVADSDPN